MKRRLKVSKGSYVRTQGICCHFIYSFFLVMWYLHMLGAYYHFLLLKRYFAILIIPNTKIPKLSKKNRSSSAAISGVFSNPYLSRGDKPTFPVIMTALTAYALDYIAVLLQHDYKITCGLQFFCKVVGIYRCVYKHFKPIMFWWYPLITNDV